MPPVGSGTSFLFAYGAGWATALLAGCSLWFTIRRRPALRGAWNTYEDRFEVADITAVATRRAIEVREIGLLFTWGPPWRRQRFHLQGPTQKDLPARLYDGASVETHFELEATIDELEDTMGKPARLIATTRPYIQASGREYRGRNLGVSPWARLRALMGSARNPRSQS